MSFRINLTRSFISCSLNLSLKAQENELSVKEGFRILSAYRTSQDVKLWVVTEADRSSTTVLLPGEY